jgi:ubiquinone/menaquinone biosynthesis C-methylase UbiE
MGRRTRAPIACRHHGAPGERQGQYTVSGSRERPQRYERETVHTLARPLAELIFAHVALHAADRVLDAACGTGMVTRVAAQRWGHLAHIVGVDLNAGMLGVARANTPTTGVPVEWRQGDVGALPFPEGSCDIVVCHYCGRDAGHPAPLPQ